jgi:hypothetical protein
MYSKDVASTKVLTEAREKSSINKKKKYGPKTVVGQAIESPNR